MEFLDKLKKAANKNNSLLCIGLDPASPPLFDFNKTVIDATADLVCAFKPNSAFYEASGSKGIDELKKTCDYIRENYPDIPIILDFKRGDIGNTNNDYAAFAFDYVAADAITVQPYMGQEAVQAFLDHSDKGIIVLCRTSNAGAGEFQDLQAGDKKLYLQVAKNVKNRWNKNGNCLLVVGATAPEELSEIRQLVGPEMTLLVPGVGAQGGDIGATLKAGGENLIISSSRGIIYANDPRQAATGVRDEINKYRSS